MCKKRCSLKNKVSFYLDIENSANIGATLKKIAKPASDMYYEEGGCMIFVFGNLFSYDLERNNPEGFLKGLMVDLKKDGTKMLENSEGVFHIILFDGERETITLVSDKLGLFPVYIFRDKNGGTRAAFKLETLLKKSVDYIFALNTESVKEFLSYGFIFDGKTLVNNVNRMTPGSIMKISPNKIIEKNYYSIDVENVKSVDNGEIEGFRKVFENVVNLRVVDSVSLRLTGGWDTRLILAAIKSIDKLRNVNAYSNSPRRDMRDWYIAGLIAKALGIKHSSLYGNDKIMLNGLLGGEMLASNLRDKFFKQRGKIEKEKGAYIKNIRIKDDVNKISYVFINSVLRSHLSTIVEGWSGIGEKYFMKNEAFPFLDTHVIEWIMSHDHKDLAGYKTYYRVFQQCYPEFLRYPWTKEDSVTKPSSPAIKDWKLPKMKFIKSVFEAFISEVVFFLSYPRTGHTGWENKDISNSDLLKKLWKRYPKMLIKMRRKEIRYLEAWLNRNRKSLIHKT
jgi:hypothetical protein